MKKLIASTFLLLTIGVNAQCDTTYLSQSKTVSIDEILSGVYYIEGNFTIQAGVTVFVNPFSANSCGKLEIHATNIVIHGTINGDYAGYPGGNGGSGGIAVNSVTGDVNALTSCSNKDNAGRVDVEGGKAGAVGAGPGGGIAGLNGGNGSGPKQVCESSADSYGMIAGAGGAGGGGGASYGGEGFSGVKGGNGSQTFNATGAPASTQYVVAQGTGGNGGHSGSQYGTQFESDIDMGSGGAGAGGGGRSFDAGMSGLRGGNGGGLVLLHATTNLTVDGTISVNGEDGKLGGQAGSGGASAKCCDDLCNDCGEATFSAGAGSGSGSGAGSGGGILLKCLGTATVTGNLSARGGIGGNAGSAGSGVTCDYSATFCGSQSISTGNGGSGGSGGDAGGGRIKLFVDLCSGSTGNPTADVSGGGLASAGTFAKVCTNTLGASELENVQFSVFPNPTSDVLHVKLISANPLISGTVYIIDAVGKQVGFQQIGETDQVSFDLADFQSGLYFVNLEFNGRVSTVKISKK